MKKRRFYYIDILNCMATFFVLLMHAAQLAHFGDKTNSYFLATNLVQTICIPAVYIFFMNSGATLLDYRESKTTKSFFIHRFKRVVVPFAFWTLLYYIYDTRYTAFPGPSFHSHPGIHDFIYAFSHNQINNIFWFFYAIIALYLATPIFSTLIHEHKALLASVVVIWFVFNDGISYVEGLTHLSLYTEYINQPLLASSYLGYFIAGYLIRINYFSHKTENILILVGVLTLLMGIINTLIQGKLALFRNIGPFFYSVAIVLLIKRLGNQIKSESVLHCFTVLSGASLGIYILHPLFYAVCDKLVFHASVKGWDQYLRVLNNPIHIFVLPIFAYIVMATAILILKRSKIVRTILP